MVPAAEGIAAVAQAASAGNNVKTKAHLRKRSRKARFLPMVSSTLTRQMDSLNISSAASQQSQKPVTTETSIAIGSPNVGTVAESNRHFAQSRQPHSEKNSLSQVPEKGASASTRTVDRRQCRPETSFPSHNEVII